MHLKDVLVTDTITQWPPVPAADWRPAAPQCLDQPLAGARCCLELARDRIGQATSAGTSMLDGEHAELTWCLTRGAFAPFEGRPFPRRHSMCGVAIESGRLELFRRPHRYFKWMSFAGLMVEEAMVCPLVKPDGTIAGTIWIMRELGSASKFSQSDAAVLFAASRCAADALPDCAPGPQHRNDRAPLSEQARCASGRRRDDTP